MKKSIPVSIRLLPTVCLLICACSTSSEILNRLNPGSEQKEVPSSAQQTQESAVPDKQRTPAIATAENQSPAVAEPPSADSTRSAPPSEPVEISAGTVIENGDLTLFIHGWLRPILKEFDYQTDEGEEVILLDFTIVNTSPHMITFYQLFYLKDEESRKHEAVYGGMNVSMPSDVTLFPGERYRGKVFFAVPEGSAGLTAILDPDAVQFEDYSYGEVAIQKVFVELSDQPGIVETSASLPGEHALPLLPFHSAHTCMDFQIEVKGLRTPDIEEYYFELWPSDFSPMLVEVLLTNLGQTDHEYNSHWMVYLRSPQGGRYTPTSMVESVAEVETIDGTLSAGESIRGEIGFLRPINLSTAALVFWCGSETYPHTEDILRIDLGSLPQ